MGTLVHAVDCSQGHSYKFFCQINADSVPWCYGRDDDSEYERMDWTCGGAGKVCPYWFDSRLEMPCCPDKDDLACGSGSDGLCWPGKTTCCGKNGACGENQTCLSPSDAENPICCDEPNMCGVNCLGDNENCCGNNEVCSSICNSDNSSCCDNPCGDTCLDDTNDTCCDGQICPSPSSNPPEETMQPDPTSIPDENSDPQTVTVMVPTTLSDDSVMTITSEVTQDVTASLSSILDADVPGDALNDPESACFLYDQFTDAYTTPDWYSSLPYEAQSLFSATHVDASDTGSCTQTAAVTDGGDQTDAANAVLAGGSPVAAIALFVFMYLTV